MISFTRETIVIICHLVTSPFKSMYFQISYKNSCRKTIEATMMKKSTRLKQIDIHNKHFYCSFLVSVDFLWQSFKHKLKKNWAVTWDFQQFDILTSVDSDEPVQPSFKLETPNDVQSVA